MARRKDGRELFEIFKETKAAKGGGAYVGPERTGQVRTPSLHTLRLGDRHQVEVFLSLGWVYGIAFFVFLALVGAFILGRRTAPEPQPVETVEAGPEFAEEAAAVTRTRRPAAEPPAAGQGAETAAARTTAPAQAEPEGPAPVTTQGLYTLRVATYQNVSAQRRLAEEFVEWLKEKGYDARIIVSRSGKSIYVTIGSFETTKTDAAARLLSEVRSLKYKNASLGDAFYQNVNTL